MSGNDDMREAAKAHLAALGIYNASVVAHAETKLAVHMVDNGIRDVTVVINNVACKGRLSCDRLLPAILPEGSTLTVYGATPDGSRTVKRYTGGAKR